MADKPSLSGVRLPADASAPEQSARRGQLAAPWTIRVTSTNDTVAVGEELWVDPNGATRTVALPSSPAPGQRCVVGHAGATATYPVNVSGTVNGDVDGARLVTPGVCVTFVYVSASLGWRIESTNTGGGTPGAMAVETDTSHRSYLAQSQTIPSAVDRVVWFPTVSRASPLVANVAYSTGTKFTLGRAGVWVGTTTVRVPAASSGECYVAWNQLNADGSTTVLCAHGGGFGGTPGTRTVPLFDDFDANAEVFVGIYQSSGADRVIEHNGGVWAHVKIGWVHD